MAQTKINANVAHTAPVHSSLFEGFVKKPWFSKTYVFLALTILLGTTVFWSILSARVHSGNADQLVNPFLFDGRAVMHGALLPGQHSFLLKWPVFFITKFYGETTNSFITATVIISVATVSGLAYVIHRIDKRPYIKGTLFLCIAAVLFAIPAQPYPGGLLPVNMAMIATRNIEYILYIGSAWAIVRSRRIWSSSWLIGCIGLVLLVASDKLFLTLSVGAAIVSCIIYVLRQHWSLASFSVRWLIATLLAACGALLLLTSINALHIVTIAGQGNSPYRFISTSQQLLHGLLGAFWGLLTNFGANPAFNTITIKQIPSESYHHISSLGGPLLFVNLLLLVGGVAASVYVLRKSLRLQLNVQVPELSDSQKLSLLLIWTSLAAYAAFIATDHYYPVDARYLAIGMFTMFISIASYVRTRQWDPTRLVVLGVIVSGCIVLSVPMVLKTYHQERDASVTVDTRNFKISQAISSHKVTVLVGDYWRVLPIKQLLHSSATIMPLDGCTSPRGVLSSAAWQPNLKNTSFAYILSLDKSQTDFPQCNLNTVYDNYGKPNVSVVIDGTIAHPKELLLFYDQGSQKSSLINSAPSPLTPTVDAITVQDLPSNVCSVPTVMNIVAHEDDDLLFMNPDIQHDIASGSCQRTIYITAGDAGSNEYYWLGREQGSEAAYSKMINHDSVWIQRIVKLDTNQYITIANPKGNSKISLIFMRLPDGNVDGKGFKSQRHESLQKLINGQIPLVHSIYGNSAYSADDLTHAITELMHFYQPAEIRTQASFISSKYPDHSDHISVSRFTDLAFAQYETKQYNNNVNIPIKHYIGYPVHAMPQNVQGNDLDLKTSSFLGYAKHDGSVCQSIEQCAVSPAYGAYLRRQYTQ